MTPEDNPLLRSSEMRWLAIFLQEVRQYAILLLDAHGIIRSANAGVESVFGYGPDELAGRHFSLLYPPESVKGGVPEGVLARAAGRGHFEETGVRVRKDGSHLDAEVVVMPVVDPDTGSSGFGLIVRDVSERVAASDLLQASESRLQSLVDTVLDTLVDGLIIIDRHGHIQLYNRACEGLFGYSAGEVLGRNVKMLMPPAVSDEHDSYLSNYQQTGVRKIIGISREVVGRRRDGSEFPMHLAVGETSHMGQPIYVGIIRDLTQRNRVEEQLRQSQKMEAVGQLTGGIAHDFNNILMVIMANVDALLDERDLRERVIARINNIAASAQRASDLTGQLLAFSRKQNLRPEPTDLNQLVSRLARLLGRTLGEHIEMDLRLQDGLWQADIDRTQLEAAVVNLCVNARDAMPEGGRLMLEMRNVRLDEDYIGEHPEAVVGDYAMLAISDNGCGMSPEIQARIFEPFFTTKDVGKGTGLGLSMVYGFMRQSRGYIHVYSEEGNGTTVRLYLPRSGSSRAEVLPSDESAIPAGTERILVVEDNEQVRTGVVDLLSSLGYEVHEAANGQAALAVIERTVPPFRLLLTDVVMPGPVGGRALAEQVMTRWPDMAIIFMSGYTENVATRQGGLPAGALLLEKPFRKRDLARMVRAVLDAED